MIHAVDLSTMVKKLVYDQPSDLEYINAIDCSPNRTQSKLINTVSDAMGGLEVNKLTYLEAIFYDDYNIQTLNINLIPTDLLLSQEDLTESVEKHRTYAEGESNISLLKKNSSCGNTKVDSAKILTKFTRSLRLSGI